MSVPIAYRQSVLTRAIWKRIGNRLAALIGALAAIQSIAGLVLRDEYRDNTFVRAAWFANDLVTLALAVPLLVGALVMARRGSRGAQLIVLGVLDYMLYNYAFYLFGSAFSLFFMLYVVLFALSVMALVSGLVGLDALEAARSVRRRRRLKGVAVYMIVVGLGLSGVYVAQWIGFIVTGILPPIVELTGHPTSIVFALDLTLVVPYMILGAVLLWRGNVWGEVLGMMLNIKGALYMLVLALGSAVAASSAYPQAAEELPLWGMLAVASICSVLLLSRRHDVIATRERIPKDR